MHITTVSAATESTAVGIEQGDADEVVDLDPLGDGVLAAGAGAVGDRRDAAQGAEAVAVVDERLGAGGQGRPEIAW